MQLVHISAAFLKLLGNFLVKFTMTDMFLTITFEILVLHRFCTTINAIVPINSN